MSGQIWCGLGAGGWCAVLGECIPEHTLVGSVVESGCYAFAENGKAWFGTGGTETQMLQAVGGPGQGYGGGPGDAT
eukprot:scaffold44294_cov49-Phaeocystis_antarctica.AAC.1